MPLQITLQFVMVILYIVAVYNVGLHYNLDLSCILKAYPSVFIWTGTILENLPLYATIIDKAIKTRLRFHL